MTTYNKPYEIKPNTGSIRASKTKSHPKAPDYYGSFKVDLRGLNVVDNCVEFKLSGWKELDKSGNQYLSLKVNNYTPTAQGLPPAMPTPQHDDQDDDIPF